MIKFGEEFYGESESEKKFFLIMSYWAGQRCFEREND